MVSGPGGTIGAPKSTLAALRAFVEDEGPAPDEIIEVRLIEEFGWTLTELDEQDEARALRILAARNIEAAVRQVTNAVTSHQLASVPAASYKLWLLTHSAEENEP